MKIKFYFLLACCLCLGVSTPLNAQQVTTGAEIITPSDFFITAPLRDLPMADLNNLSPKETPRGTESQRKAALAEFLKGAGASPTQVDPLAQTEPQTRAGDDPLLSFDGVNVSNLFPPDPTAAVGPNHIVQMTNRFWGVWDKEGNLEPGFPKNINDPIGGSISGDPIVLYDREADRWFISQFQFGSSLRFAVSETPDPTGSYFVYSFPLSSNDYPHYSIYGNSYIVAGNFSPSGRFLAFNREKILAGDPSAEAVTLTMPGFRPGTVFRAPQPVHSEGAGAAAGSAPIVWFHDDAWGGVSQDAAVVWEFDVDWNNPGSASVTGPIEIPLADFDSFIAGTGGDAFANLAQPGVSQRIDALVHVMNFQAHRYDFGTHESMIFNFVVEINNGSRQAGLRWVELRRSGGGDWELYQEGTYVDPTGNDESVFMGAMSMDQEGNMAMGYIKTGPDTFPSLYYTGRAPGDDLGQMTIQETLIVAGTNSINQGNSRYGDYGQLVRDPVDDLTFWYTSQYSGSSPERTRIAAFKISEELSVDELQAAETDFVITSSDNRIFDVNLLSNSTNDMLRLSVYDVLGNRVIYSQVKKNSSGVYYQQLDMNGKASGVYIVSVGNAKTKMTKQIIVR
ncbi:T9SS type A sorting domain-containing protein [Aureitalea marina]|uniref:Secretion system C-terminal sorting domain-containing protein n=1 Tax=Aureitalea marina TaxID=930804 RepID=A0A2S7KSP5_9FLAO|nr:T9SS type A sorting domain-containing protein [Aureitalea marina]PQB05651.1 hypothetical protein BST85_12655 [Aureitalea marina]